MEDSSVEFNYQGFSALYVDKNTIQKIAFHSCFLASKFYYFKNMSKN